MTATLRSRVVAVSSAVLMAGGLVALTPGSAGAAPHVQVPQAQQVGYTDAATPFKAYDWTPGQDLPLGAWRDDARREHVSRVYLTYDVAGLAGKRVIGGTVTIRENNATDCTKRAVEIWQTRPIAQTPTWISAPLGLRKLDEITTAEHCPGTITFDVSAAISDAVAHQRQRVTFELRVPARHERDSAFGRRLVHDSRLGLAVTYNSPPAINAQARYNGGFPCAQSAPFPALGAFAGTLQAQASDADADDQRGLDYEFALWPADRPAARTVLTADNGTTVGTVAVPQGVLVDGRTYSWQVRVGDGVDTSAWSGVCSFVFDQTAPAAPAVTSANYPPSGSGALPPVGAPGVFTFTATDSGTVGFQYGWDMLPVLGACDIAELGRLVCYDPFSRPGTVRADRPGGAATVSLVAPHTGPSRLLVRAIDSAGLASPEARYEVFVPFGGAPTVTAVGGEPRWGQHVTLRFAPDPAITGTVSYEYRINDNPVQTVAAGPDGTATVSFTADNASGPNVAVRSRSANGWVSPEFTWRVVFWPWPDVRSDIYLPDGVAAGGVGVTGTFTFSPPPGWTEVAGYEYAFNGAFGGADPVFVAAGPDGTATITWAPDTSGSNSVDVFAVRPDGSTGDYSNTYLFEVS